MYSYHIFADTVSHLACFNLVSLPRSWCASQHLTSADLCPSRFMWLVSTPRMTAPANCTSVCLLTQRPARLLSKVRSDSDYNPFPSLLWVSFAPLVTAAFPAHFTWDSHVTQKTGTSPRWPCLNQQHFYLIEFCRTANKEEQMTLYPCKQKLRRHFSKALRSKGHTKDKRFAWWAFKSQSGSKSLERLI